MAEVTAEILFKSLQSIVLNLRGTFPQTNAFVAFRIVIIPVQTAGTTETLLVGGKKNYFTLKMFVIKKISCLSVKSI